jgi:predicted small lipoprotein YifL
LNFQGDWSMRMCVSQADLGRLAAVAAIALVLAGCGVRGSLDAPQAGGASETASADSGQGKPEGATPKPHKGFILDGLLR